MITVPLLMLTSAIESVSFILAEARPGLINIESGHGRSWYACIITKHVVDRLHVALATNVDLVEIGMRPTNLREAAFVLDFVCPRQFEFCVVILMNPTCRAGSSTVHSGWLEKQVGHIYTACFTLL